MTHRLTKPASLRPLCLKTLKMREAIDGLIAHVAKHHFAGIGKVIMPSPSLCAAPPPQDDAAVHARIKLLQAENAAAPAWGAATTARNEEIRALQAGLSARNSKEGV